MSSYEYRAYIGSLILCLLAMPLQQHAARYSLELRPEEQTPQIQLDLKKTLEDNDIETVTHLIRDKGIEVDAPLPGGLFTPLTFAVYKKSPDMVLRLLNLAATIDEPSPMGHTPLTLAAGLPGGLEILRLLITQGAELDERNKKNHTAVQAALLNGQLDNAKELLKRGAALTAEDVRALPQNAQERAHTLLRDPEIANARLTTGAQLEDRGMYDVLRDLIQKKMMGQE